MRAVLDPNTPTDPGISTKRIYPCPSNSPWRPSPVYLPRVPLHITSMWMDGSLQVDGSAANAQHVLPNYGATMGPMGGLAALVEFHLL
ncbi:hypothetical protein E2C01_030838 [Portunus trituberculatus]|uniref:Uncharacterized protein n=1 Tax=Portunus trituberculatus TaxID=210409 RepID=A0A5B7EYG5_PORTR|nr:hypothetical protein [Portunus trituberculatus]